MKRALPGNFEAILDLRPFWDRATPISSAHYELNQSEDSRRYVALFPRSYGLNVALNVLAESMKTEGTIDPRMRITQAEREESERLRDRLRDVLYRRIAAGDLVPLGFVHPRKVDDKPRLVPLDLFRRVMNWDSGRVEGHGLRIDDVRVIDVDSLLLAIDIPGPFTLVPPPKKGRPSKQALIREAYEACKRAGVIDFAASKKVAALTIRNWIEANRPEEYESGKGLGAEIIRRTISADFDACRVGRSAQKL